MHWSEPFAGKFTNVRAFSADLFGYSLKNAYLCTRKSERTCRWRDSSDG